MLSFSYILFHAFGLHIPLELTELDPSQILFVQPIIQILSELYWIVSGS